MSTWQEFLPDGIELINDARKAVNGLSKSVRYVLLYAADKIEIIGKAENQDVIFKYHQAKYDKDQSRIFCRKIGQKQCWL